eukprot:TRINITY_DN13188_c0_g1_i1.p1 TRINITY_DN13188_c0_g1~~TRINITY_DN13188_c0_g1_i1.p1  ORF type:complete len:124 (+),score=48.02 TRINITY_DN13188_c0_g1_i1:72-443(+)
MYYRGSHGIMLVYDITSRNSFDKLEKHLENANLHAQDAAKVLVGNKIDLASAEREVATDEALKLAKRFGMSHYETSAKTTDGVEEMFVSFVRQAFDKLKETSTPEEWNQFVLKEEVKSNDVCC